MESFSVSYNGLGFLIGLSSVVSYNGVRADLVINGSGSFGFSSYL